MKDNKILWAIPIVGLFCSTMSAADGDFVKSRKALRSIEFSSQLTEELLIKLVPGENPNEFARNNDLEKGDRLKSDQNTFLFKPKDDVSADQLMNLWGGLKQDNGVESVFLNQKTGYVKFGFTPDDPLASDQWHLATQPGINVQNAWSRNLTGKGVTIGIVDDSLQQTHEDLVPNFSATQSWDFGQNDVDPSPVHSNDNHGTAVAGAGAARGGNGIGVTGVAPYAAVAGLRIDFRNQTTAMFVDAIRFNSIDSNSGIEVKNHSYGFTAPFISTPAEGNALVESSSAETIHVFAAGNDRGVSGQDANKKDQQNSPNVITVAALNDSGSHSDFSNFGANVFITAPGDGKVLGSVTEGGKIKTTDRTGSDGFSSTNYVDINGTSFSVPVVAGVMALGKEIRSEMDVRFAKHLLVKSSDIIDSGDSSIESDGGWKENAAGNSFN